MAFHKLVVERFTVSYSFDTIRYGTKSSHFVSIGFAMTPLDGADALGDPVLPEEAAVLQQDANRMVTIAAIHDAVSRGALSTEDANDMIENFSIRQSGIKDMLMKKLEQNEKSE